MKTTHLPKQVILAAMTALLVLAALAPLAAAPDLDVAYISRTPRCYKYNVTYKDNIDLRDPGKSKPSLTPEEQAKQRWPKKGEVVTGPVEVPAWGLVTLRAERP